MAIPRYKPTSGPILFSAGFRPFFFAAAIWAAIAVPVWLVAYTSGLMPPTAMPAIIWHPHELVYGYGAAVVAGFLLTAIPNWTGGMPLQGWPLGILVLLWLAGRVAVLISGVIGEPAATVIDLAFPVSFLTVVAREIIAGKNWRNLPMLVALSVLVIGNLLVHLETLGVSETALTGNRIGIATLLALIALVGGRIVPSFTRNWLVKFRPEIPVPASAERRDTIALVITAASVVLWAILPEAAVTGWGLIIGGVAAGWRLSRWRGAATTREPLLLILHVGYGWLAVGLVLLGLDIVVDFMPQTTALHALTVGAIGTMTLAVMTRASLGHTGRPLTAGRWTVTIFVLVFLAALLRLVSVFGGAAMIALLHIAGCLWSVAFLIFAIAYGRVLSRPRASGDPKPI
jgi:uncharacterized protein involved in response to NO